MTELTPQQRQAVETLDSSVVVVAGPGAGKTRVLVERVLHILRQRRADLDEIVAITFTNKAANEMRDKIRRALRELALRSASREDASYWYDLKRRLEDAPISTIHGFAARLLRAHPVDAQVDPNFTILEEYTSQLLLTQAVEETVTEALDEADPTIGRLVMSFTRQRVIRLLTDVFVSVRTLGLTLDDVEGLTFRHLKTADDYRRAVEVLDHAIATLTRIEGLTKTMRESVETFRRTFEQYRVFLEEAPALEHAPLFDRALEALKAAKVRKVGRMKEAAAELEARLRDVELFYYDACAGETLHGVLALLRRIERRYVELKADVNGLDYEDLQWKARHLLRTRPEVARAIARSIRFILVDEFQDTNGLQKEIIDLLLKARGEEEPESRHLTLFIVGDQKQSIYGFRGAAVEVFAEAEREITARGGLRLVLGKNFRSQRPLVEFFNRFFSRLMSPPEREDADALEAAGFIGFIPDEAHRGSLHEPAVELLLEITDGTAPDDARDVEAHLIADRIAQMVRSGERLIAADREPSSSPIAVETNESLPADTPGRRAVRYGDIAILFRALSDIKIYERALRQRGIPYYVLAGKGFYERQEIQDILSLLQFLDNRTNEIALVAALRSPLFGLSDETLYWMRQYANHHPGSGLDPHPLLTSLLEGSNLWGVSDEQRLLVARAATIIRRLLDVRNRLPLVELIREIIEATDDEALQATAYDGHQRVANLRKLMELARAFDARGPQFLGDFVRYVHQFTEMETREAEAQLESANAVTLMTVHKAKGLEFPVVIVPDLNRQFRRDAPPLVFDRALGLGLKIPDARGRAHRSWLHKRICEQVARREFFENQRVLFVALTRAQDYLILSTVVAKKKKAPDDEAAEEMSGATTQASDADSPVPTESVPGLFGRSWFDWFRMILGVGDPEALPTIYEWKGVKLKVTRRADLPGGEQPAAVRPLIERFPELGQGHPLPPEKLPPLAEDEQRALAMLLERVAPTAPMWPGRRTISVTRLLALARCPRQFYYEDVLGLPPLDEYEEPELTREGTSLPAAVRGHIIHRFCQLYDGTESWEELLARLVSEHLAIEASDATQAVEAAVTHLRPLVENYLRSDLYRTIEQILWGSRPGSVRSEYEILYRAETMLVRGRIDKLILSDDGVATIVDFKTNRADAAETDRLVHEYAVQMQLYALAVRHLMCPRAIRAELYFLIPNERRVLPEEWL
ncbi:MAG TPA: UvrD-helicase domain-containing protein, partial [Blastocatellia bacterium]|nr:UvrD-helicase domain-containing protein [Blastocatellia bacterium]